MSDPQKNSPNDETLTHKVKAMGYPMKKMAALVAVVIAGDAVAVSCHHPPRQPLREAIGSWSTMQCAMAIIAVVLTRAKMTPLEVAPDKCRLMEPRAAWLARVLRREELAGAVDLSCSLSQSPAAATE